MEEPSRREGLVAQRWLLVGVGVVLALMVYVAGYDVSGREPPCFEAESELRGSHPDAVEFRSAGGGWSLTQSCEAVDANGTVVGRVTYPGTGDWILAAVLLVAPLALAVAWPRFRARRRRAEPA